MVVTLAQISDCHLFADKHKRSYRQIAPYASLSAVLADISQRQIDVLLVSGDLSGDGSLASYQHFSDLLVQHQLTCRIVIVPGNHDELLHMQQQFKPEQLWSAYPPEQPLQLGNWQIQLLNTKGEGTAGYLDPAILQRLGAALALQQDRFQLIAAHHHPLPCYAWMDQHSWSNGAELVSVLQAFASVRAVLYGHIHHAAEQQINDCRYLACPSTCWQWAMQAQFAISELHAGYRLLWLSADGQLNTDIIRIG